MTSSKNSGRFIPSGADVSHNATLGIQGGAVNDYQHLTTAEKALIAYTNANNTWSGTNTFSNFVATGIPIVPTAAVDTNTTQAASCAFVIAQSYLKITTAASTYAPINSPTLTGTPKTTTPALSDNSTNIASTAYVQTEKSYMKKDFGMYDDSMYVKRALIRNPQMDNNRPTGTRIVYNPLTTGAFTTDMIGKQFICTNAGSGTRDFVTAGGANLLKNSDGTLVATGTPLVLNSVYIVYAAGTPVSWGGTELTSRDVITVGKWYICKGGTVTYDSVTYAETTWTAYPTVSPSTGAINIAYYPFKGTVSGGSTYTVATGTPVVYELDYIVVESSIGNGTSSGTITLNWVPYIDSLFNPTTGKEWAIKRLDSRTDLLKITGGDYTTKTLYFTAISPTTFSSTSFHSGNLISLYNPYESVVDIDWTTRILSSIQAYSWAATVASCGIFKRKSDGLYCGLFLGTSSKNRVGYYTTSDFETITIGNSNRPIFDGALTDTYLNSGTLKVTSKYKVIATEPNHFGSGVVVGDYIVASATTACDANNIVRLVDDRFYDGNYVSSPEYIGVNESGGHMWEVIGEFRNKEANIDSYCFIRFDEDFSDEYMKFIPLDNNFIVMGDAYDSTYPALRTSNNMTYVYYDGKHRLYCTVSTSDGTVRNYTYPWVTFEYISTGSKYGPYTTRKLVHVRDAANDAYICNRDVETFMPFVYNNELYAISTACSGSGFTGMDADRRGYALWKYSRSKDSWNLDYRSPIVVPPINENDGNIWTGTTYAQSHVGGIFSYCIDGDTMHVNVTCKSTGINYTVFYGTVDLKDLTKP